MMSCDTFLLFGYPALFIYLGAPYKLGVWDVALGACREGLFRLLGGRKLREFGGVIEQTLKEGEVGV